MRFQLYALNLTRGDRQLTGFVIAPDELRAADIVVEHEMQLNQENGGFTLERVDETLPKGQREGLDALLENAPVGMASYSEPIGWVAHAIPAPKLALFKIDTPFSEPCHIVAPTMDMASAIYCTCIPIDEGEEQMFSINDGQFGLSDEMRRGLPALLEFGPIGIVEWQAESGWFLSQF